MRRHILFLAVLICCPLTENFAQKVFHFGEYRVMMSDQILSTPLPDSYKRIGWEYVPDSSLLVVPPLLFKYHSAFLYRSYPLYIRPAQEAGDITDVFHCQALIKHAFQGSSSLVYERIDTINNIPFYIYVCWRQKPMYDDVYCLKAMMYINQRDFSIFSECHRDDFENALPVFMEAVRSVRVEKREEDDEE
ncbi:MAG: hypothetical protein ACI36X_03210 [Bacteroidaceae bacterium]